MRRRLFVAGAAGAAGLAAGVGTAIWRLRASGSRGTAAGEPSDIWSMSFATVDGAPLAMTSLRGKALLVNFWATWCAPCATEMPLLDAFARKGLAHGWNVLALAVDAADPVRRFLAERALSLPVAVAGAEGLGLSRALGNSVGALPFTVTFAADGQVEHRKLGALDARLLESWTSLALDG